MKIEVKIIDDNGDVLAEHKADASQPSMWRAPSGSRFISDMPRQSEQPPTGTYELYGITFQPHLRVERPNGYVAPLPSFPFNGIAHANTPTLPNLQSFGVAAKSFLSSPQGQSKG